MKAKALFRVFLGFIFSHKEYLQKARELTEKYGVLLILDEVVTGFRFHAGALQSLYGIKPDLIKFLLLLRSLTLILMTMP
ncbi:MAG: aminotransferase class III-fold pyridoxal phosphate-dependent enzyme [Candidatus Aminicenantes bacterium]|nr:aminotransferase class III-fold pyridoxal phosphate-dependent enzyme [Candidatus Aminicenantes bacterium]